MTPETLQMVAVELYGAEHWKAKAIEALGVSERTFRRWLAGTAPIPDSIRLELIQIINSKFDQLEDMLAELERGD